MRRVSDSASPREVRPGSQVPLERSALPRPRHDDLLEPVGALRRARPPRPTSAHRSVARCQVSWPPISATEAPKRRRAASLSERTTLRFDFRLRSATWSRASITQTNRAATRPYSEGLLDLLGLEDLEDVADLDVGEAVERDAALLAVLDLA